MRNSAVPAIILFIVCVTAVLTAGCFLFDQPPPFRQETVTPTPSPAPESGLSIIGPSAMALQPADLPPGYIIKERSAVAYTETSPLARELGWKNGYFVSFYRMNMNQFDITAISQQVSVYNVGNVWLLDNTMQSIFDTVKSDLMARANSTVSVTELPFPVIGDRTAAVRTADPGDPYGILTYTIIFTKKDVIEQIDMRGTTTDYEVLKNIAAKAAGKIR
jgi:hypothetical protein